jgi:glycosyltransferase involved in cell wall biosynthesis
MSTTRPGLLFIVNSLEVGGAEKQVVTLLNHLDSSHFRLHLAYLKPRDRLLPQLDTGKLDTLTCCNVTRGVEPRAVRQLADLIRAHRIDAVICTNMYSMLYGYLACARIRPRPKLATVFHTTLLRTYKEKAQMLLYRHLFRRSDLLIYVSENQRDRWRDWGLRAAADAVVQNGIDVDYFSAARTPRHENFRASLGLTEADYVIGLCSGLRPEKAHGDLLHAIARLRERGIAAKALLIGEGPERPRIESLILELGLSEHVVITGLQEDVRPYIACCDVMTLVSHTETFSLAALESMALGKPLVMSDIGGASEQVVHGQTGLLFEPHDIAALTEQLTTLGSAALRARMGAAAERRVRELYSLRTMTSGFTAQVSRLLDGASLTSGSVSRS